MYHLRKFMTRIIFGLLCCIFTLFPIQGYSLSIQREITRTGIDPALKANLSKPEFPNEFPSPRTTEPVLVWISFTDKGLQDADGVRDAVEIIESTLDNHTKIRMQKHGRVLDFTDIPVYPPYLDALEAMGAILRSTSRWFNAASVSADAETITQIAQLPFVAGIESVKVHKSVYPFPTETYISPSDRRFKQHDLYGLARTQLDIVNATPLIERGLTGAGVRIGFLDGGFAFQTHRAFSQLRVIAEHDFVFNDDSTGYQDNQDGTEGVDHGTGVLSIAAGYDPGTYIGPAYNSEVLLAKTEWDTVEVRQEEDFFVAGIEWAEQLGADIISTSLGYFDFDNGFTYSYSQLDGKTAVTTIAAQEAFERGVVFINSVGNYGMGSTGQGTLSTPSDAAGVIAVGSVTSSGNRAGYSSVGPSADGRIKPDVMAMGSNVYYAQGDTVQDYRVGGGTSFAAPMVAAVAALLLEAHPQWTASQIREALLQTASRVAQPDNFMGYGIINAVAADAFHLPSGVDNWHLAP